MSMDWMPEWSMSTGLNLMARAVTGLGPSTSAVESKFGPPECPGSRTTTGRSAVQVGVAFAAPVDVGTGGLGSEEVAALSVEILAVLDVGVVLAIEVASVLPVVPDTAAVGVLT